MKEGVGADDLRLVLQHDATLDLGSFQVVKGAERAIGDALVGEWPQAFTGLQFRRIGGQEEQVDTLGHDQLGAAMPTRLIEHQQHALARSCADCLGEVRQRDRKDWRRHTGQQVPLGLARGF